MKEFNLDAALNGEPVKLANGNKAIVYYQIPDEYVFEGGAPVVFPLRGLIFNSRGVIENLDACWRDDGRFSHHDDPFNIIGMWEEPKLTSEQVLEKAYNEDLLVLCDGNPDLPLKIIAKTKDGEFVMQPEDDTIQPWLANLTMEWFFVKDLDPKIDTITNTISLPKPFKPKNDEQYYYINEYGVQHVKHFDEYDESDLGMAKNAHCYRTREDAQKWLDFMKSMME